jgi:hypothetical protein
MAEETEQEGTWSGLKKTIIGVASTAVVAVGTWATSLLGGGDKAEPAPAQAAPVININNTQQQQQAAGGGGKTVIIKEKSAAPAQSQPKPKKKEGDEFKEEAPKW